MSISNFYGLNPEENNPLVKSQNEWEEKMKLKGWSYVKDETTNIPTWIFCSPKRKEIVLKRNAEFLQKKLKDRQKILSEYFPNNNKQNAKKTNKT